MLIRLLLAFAVRRDLTVRCQGQAIQTLTSKYKEKRGTKNFKSKRIKGLYGRDQRSSNPCLVRFMVRTSGPMSVHSLIRYRDRIIFNECFRLQVF